MTRNSFALVPYVEPNVTSHKPDIELLKEILTWRRPEGSSAQKGFCRQFLQPVMGNPDRVMNYNHLVGPVDTGVVFMAHHDTVHSLDGRQAICVEDDFIKLPVNSRSNCLGADCGTGVWLILHMIKCGIPGRYIIHSGEEGGGAGAKHIVKQKPDWLNSINACISFDRYGTTSVITHQSSTRTASDLFADSVIRVLPDLNLSLDRSGTFTDSDVYSDIVPECTNLSVGYYSQHGSSERQNIPYAIKLANSLVNANWKSLLISRDPNVVEYDNSYVKYNSYWKKPNNKHFKGGYDFYDDFTDIDYEELDLARMVRLIKEDPQSVGEWLQSIGFDSNDVFTELYPYTSKGKGR